ncbi:TIGR02253 family HAD-type hydrolase [Pyrococcus abyssi]|uniref:Glyceraldehyde 3-phosphate phosphatase n=1 Tax=Pyrococcus abyssi (strain GE5 / Orsay) TaxID=272844 RepID=Q9UYC9_PYRAB|nr:TIGR02253 family HAD-type hydrolase [Pyrococcus abyssi]CAB50483.1 2-haloalkanoic acid dehalogenase (EC 3.8.1.2) related protein [Pyrococcus abyssi GE5]CCE71036.1 TPA: 2-haloalkanoic acid dehalogenase [Pyrococcus abyssi GE5]
MIRAVFFDFVGTLLSSEGEAVTHLKIMEEVLKGYNLDPRKILEEYEKLTREAFSAYAGKPYRPIRDIEEEIMRKISEEYGFKYPENFWEIHLKMHQEYGKLYPEVVEVLKELRQSYHVGMITDSDTEYLNAHLEALGVRDLFDSITTSEEAGFFKPHPRIFEIALRKAGVKGEDAVYVGDNPVKDCGGAKNLGMISILLDRTGEKKDLWDRCDFVVSDLREVIKIVKGQ